MKFDGIRAGKTKFLWRSYSAEEFLSACDDVIEGVQEVLERYGGGRIIIQDVSMKMEKKSATIKADTINDSLQLLKRDYKLKKHGFSGLSFKSKDGTINGKIEYYTYHIIAYVNFKGKELEQYEDLRKTIKTRLKHFKRKKSFPNLLAASGAAIPKHSKTDRDFPDVWTDIPDDEKREGTPKVWDRKVIK
jgi:hypothetical protein